MKITKIHPLAGVLDFDADDFTRLAEIKNNILRNFLGVGAGNVAQLDI